MPNETKIEFTKTINSSEARSRYLNLTDDAGRSYGRRFPERGTKLAIIDGAGRRTNAKKHNFNENQIWSGIQRWHDENEITPGTKIKVTYDSSEYSSEGFPVVHLEVLASPTVSPMNPPVLSQVNVVTEMADQASELPISLERQLEDFLVINLGMIEPGLQLYREDGDEGRQYPTEIGIIDLLCIRANGELLVVELKRGRSSDIVVGQISRYMGWVARHIANGRIVKGLILTYDRDEELRYAVLANPNISLKRFKLRLEILPDEAL